mmetsp:Transcript_25255/g.80019  ORF Transcript_25255/g.80019 Transcript_25255/m.80019 type:complete len:355 (+) Transcript_25255:262-1326(+)
MPVRRHGRPECGAGRRTRRRGRGDHGGGDGAEPAHRLVRADWLVQHEECPERREDGHQSEDRLRARGRHDALPRSLEQRSDDAGQQRRADEEGRLPQSHSRRPAEQRPHAEAVDTPERAKQAEQCEGEEGLRLQPARREPGGGVLLHEGAETHLAHGVAERGGQDAPVRRREARGGRGDERRGGAHLHREHGRDEAEGAGQPRSPRDGSLAVGGAEDGGERGREDVDRREDERHSDGGELLQTHRVELRPGATPRAELECAPPEGVAAAAALAAAHATTRGRTRLHQQDDLGGERHDGEADGGGPDRRESRAGGRVDQLHAHGVCAPQHCRRQKHQPRFEHRAAAEPCDRRARR